MTDRLKTVYPLKLRFAGGIIIIQSCLDIHVHVDTVSWVSNQLIMVSCMPWEKSLEQ